MGLRLAYNTNGFAHHALDDCLRILADLGYDGVALTLDVHHLDPRRASPRSLDDLSATLDRLGLRRTVETGARFLLDPLRKHEPSLLAADGWDRRMRFLERSIEIASEIQAPVVTFSSGSADPRLPVADQRGLLAERCLRLAESASRKGVRLGFEPEPGMFVEDLTGFVEFRESFAHEALGLTLDIGHVHLTEDRPPADVVRAFADCLLHVHLEDMRRPEHRHLAIGEGEIEFPPVLAVLEEIGYEGLVALELSRDSHRAPEVARAAIEALRGAGPGRR